MGFPSAYRWQIPNNLVPDTSYKIIIKSITDPSIIDTSDASFSIIPPSEVEVVNSEIPDEYDLFQNYPNPFNPSTKIRYSLPFASNVTIKVYNSLGEYIATIVDNKLSPGNYEVDWNASNLASGIYIYSLEAIPSDENQIFHSVKKMILLK